ncbi:hypothetical protein TREES_T100004622 [Tupaia chinensis]|uniref:DUF1907 domain-containing protein n=1 Tax=Tupaia chinensis TaxID=246437 RepID=L8YBB9_TUPCH|nr:hypothetical protein TREES_T100004622 [Tupaia chinensis]
MKRKVVKTSKLRLSPNEEACILKEDYERRRKLRLLQVREQEKDIALQIREEIKQRRNQQFTRLAEELRAEWEESQIQKIQNLEKLYLASLRNMGGGHRQAKENEPDLDALAQRAAERKRKADLRHKEALKVQKSQKELLMKQKTRHIKARKEALLTEKERSAKITSLPAPPPPLFENQEKLMKELEQLQQEDLARRRQTVAQMPPQLVELPYRRSEMKEDWQRELEFAFEDMYNADRIIESDTLTIESGTLTSEDKPLSCAVDSGKEQAVAQSSVLLHPQEEAARIRMSARQKQIMEIEEQKQKQLELLEQIEQQKLRLETHCFRAQLEEKRKTTQQQTETSKLTVENDLKAQQRQPQQLREWLPHIRDLARDNQESSHAGRSNSGGNQLLWEDTSTKQSGKPDFYQDRDPMRVSVSREHSFPGSPLTCEPSGCLQSLAENIRGDDYGDEAVLQKGLKTNFADVQVSVVDCPDLTKEPFTFPVKGICGKTRIAEVGGVPYLLPLINREKVIEVKAKRRTGQLNFVTCMRQTLGNHYGDKPVGMGGTFIVQKGKVKTHIMGFDLRLEHTHFFSHHGEGGHYHYDTTPETVEYLGYFLPAELLYRIDQPKETHLIGRD